MLQEDFRRIYGGIVTTLHNIEEYSILIIVIMVKKTDIMEDLRMLSKKLGGKSHGLFAIH